jgi:methionyl-tRNA formyltransferase
MQSKKIVFMGTGPFAYHILKALYYSNHQILVVFTKQPKEQGRGMKLIKNPVQLFAEEKSLPIETPISLKNYKNYLALLEADVTVVASYGLIIPKELLWIYKSGTINLHPSALPRWRGAAPIERSIMADDLTTDLCVMQMDEGLDTGPILMRYKLPLDPRFTGTELTVDFSKMSAYLLLDTLQKLDIINIQSQGNNNTIYANKILAQDEKIDWYSDGSKIVKVIMALSPNAFCYYNEARIKIVKATLTKEKSSASPGTIIDKNLKVATGDSSVIQINQIQKAGGKVIDVKAFLCGNNITIGDCFT